MKRVVVEVEVEVEDGKGLVERAIKKVVDSFPDLPKKYSIAVRCDDSNCVMNQYIHDHKNQIQKDGSVFDEWPYLTVSENHTHALVHKGKKYDWPPKNIK